MAEDKLIFPIGFDLEKGVKEAQNDVDGYLRRIAAAVEKHPITVKVQLDQKPRLSTAVRAESQRATRELAGFKKEMAEINRQWNALSARDRGGDMGARLMARYRELTQEAKGYTSTVGAAVKLEDRLAKQRERSANAATNAAQKTREYNNELKSQDGYISRLVKRLAVYAGFSAIRTFLTSVRNVTAEFELQRVSLGAIIQDQNRANQLFSEIKTFALKSPISIMDLTKYTKQLAAYKIETNSLFDTTKRLADVSVGLGVSMDRIILAYGQVKAASYLRAAEIRQFTEAGIPMLELLAEKFTELQGKAVSTEQVMDMVSKRAVSFSMVEEIFKDMTSAGGMFYNMQEKQGNTLFGLWAKLGDAAAVMYDEIGNTDWVNEGMENAIQLLTELMRNWKAVSKTAVWVVLPNAAIAALYKYSTATTRVMAAQRAVIAAEERRIAVEKRLRQAIEEDAVADRLAAGAALKKAQADEIAAKKAASSWGLMKSGVASLAKSFITGLGIGTLITFVTSLSYKFFEAWENAHRLKNTLNEIDTERIVLTSQSVRNFEKLANVAVKAADGSKQQKDALDELHRTYKDMIPVEDMTIDRLRAMHGNYTMLTDAIREYINEQQKQKALSAVTEEYGGKQQAAMRNLYNWFDEQGLSAQEREAFFREFENQAEDSSKTLKEKIVAAFEDAGIEGGEKLAKAIAQEKGFFDKTFAWLAKSLPMVFGALYASYRAVFPDVSYIGNLNEAIVGYNENIRAVLESYDRASGKLGEFKNVMDEVAKAQADVVYKDSKGNILDDSSYQKQQMQINRNIKDFANKIRNDETFKKAFQKIGVDIQEQWFDIVDKLNENDLGHISSIQFDAIIKAVEGKHPQLEKALKMWQNEYNNMVPSDEGVQVTRAKFVEIANEMGPKFIDRVKSGLRGATESLKDYRKRIKDIDNDLAVSIKSINAELAMTPVYDVMTQSILGAKLKDAEELKDHYDKILAILPDFGETRGGGSDPRLGILQEMVSTLKNINKEYDELEKKEGATKALADTQRIYADTFKNMQSLAKKYKFNLPDFGVPTDAASLTKYLDAIREAMKKLPKSDKAVLALQVDIDKLNLDDAQKKIDKQLKELADRISRTKTAKEFYEKILSQTGDVELATRVSLSIYGSTGEELFEDTVKQIREVFKSGKEDVVIDLEPVFDMTNQRIDYKMLADIYEKYQNDIIDKNRDTAKKIAQEGQKATASNIANWQKELAKAQSFEEQRTAIVQRESEKRARIIKEVRDPKERNRLVSLSYDKQAQDLAKLAIDEFKSSDDYIKVFQDLDRVSTQTLERMTRRLKEMIAVAKEGENVEGLKTLVEQLDKIKEERDTRNPIEGIIDSFKEYAKARQDYRLAEADEAKVKSEFAQQEIGLNQAITDAKALQEAAQQRVTDLEAQGKLNTDEGVAAQLALNDATTKVTQATEKRNQSVKKVEKAEQKTTDALDAQKAAIAKLSKNVNAMANAFSSAASSIQTIADMMGIAEDSELGDIVNGLVSGLNNAATIMTTILAIAIAIEAACWWLLAIGGAIAAFSAIGSWLTGSKVRKANKEIKRQQQLLDQLEYTYGRLENAADKLFGTDYLQNYNQQIANLQAQQAAYLKQAQAERSKGKKKDKEKIKEYEEAARDALDKIEDMQGQVAERMLGTDLTSAARDFANAWLEAYKEFGNTADAMSEKFHEMIQNMIVESLLAKVMERALKPAFDMIDNMNEEDFYSESFWKKVKATAEQGAKDADHGAGVVMKWIEQMGYDMREMGSEYSGIAKEVSSASSEEINQLSAFVNTALYYVSPIPTISENVSLIRQLMERGTTSTLPDTTAAGWTDWQQQAMDNYIAIQRNTADTVVRCERAAVACEAIAEKIGRVVVNKGGKFGVNSFLNS